MSQSLPEVWLRGPLEGVPPLLQPVAHALLQATEEVEALMANFSDDLLWSRPAGVASPGFHLLHIAGVLDRLFTYATGRALTEQQLAYLGQESNTQQYTGAQLVDQLKNRVAISINLLKRVDEQTLTEKRSVGRKGLPSTVGGLLFHAAEHTMRHLGQLLVTIAVLKAKQADA